MTQITIIVGKVIIIYHNLLYAEPSTHKLSVLTLDSLPVLSYFLPV